MAIPNLICKLCLNEERLKNSHVIGDSVFKKIFRANSGKAISLSSSEEDIKYSSDSWAQPLLCSSCEKYLNEKFEQYSLAVLRGRHTKVQRTEYGLTLLGADTKKLNMYFISLLWRAANSSHNAYLDVFLNDEDNEYLRHSIFSNSQIPLKRLSVKISRLIDYTENGFTLDILKKFIVSPFSRIGVSGNKKIKVVCFTFEGFFVEFFMPGLTSKFRNERGVIYKEKNAITIPNVDVLQISEIFENMVTNYGKYVTGRSKIN